MPGILSHPIRGSGRRLGSIGVEIEELERIDVHLVLVDHGGVEGAEDEIERRRLEAFGQRLGEVFGPERVILFGSYAQGDAGEDSDVDLLVILPFEGKSVDQSVRMRMELRPDFPVDLIVRTPEKIQDRLGMGDGFIRQILDEGKVLYESNTH